MSMSPFPQIPTPGPEIEKGCPGAGAQPAHVAGASFFASDRSRPDGLAPYCKKCAATKQREWKARNPDKVRASKLKYRLRAESDLVPQT